MKTKRRKYLNTCINCKTEFHPYSREQKFCSHKCRSETNAPKRRKRLNSTCKVCKQTFEHKQYQKAKYCSKACWSKRNPPITATCQAAECNKVFMTYQRDQKYCDRSCGRKHLVGTMATNWKGGESRTGRGRFSAELTAWRASVYKRDNYTCQRCGNDGCKLNAHHVKHWADHPELRFDVSNGETLCEDCHSLEHPGKDFANRRTKLCPDCGVKTTGRGKNGLCRSCGVKRSWDHGELSSRRH